MILYEEFIRTTLCRDLSLACEIAGIDFRVIIPSEFPDDIKQNEIGLLFELTKIIDNKEYRARECHALSKKEFDILIQADVGYGHWFLSISAALPICIFNQIKEESK